MKNTVLLIAFFFLLWNMNAQSKCDSIRFYPDTYYLTQWEDNQFFDSMSYFGDNYLDYALCEYRLEDNQHMTVNGTFATHGVIGPYEFKDVLGININYLQFVTPPDTEVKGYRIVSHWSMTEACEYPVTFIINPSIAGKSEISKEQLIQVYPNPANGHVTIELDKTQNGDIRILNVLGSTVVQIPNVNGGKVTLETDGLSCGNYVVQLVKNGKALGAQKLVINNYK